MLKSYLASLDADNALNYIAKDPVVWFENFIRHRIKVAEIEIIRKGLNPNDKEVTLPPLEGLVPHVIDLNYLDDATRHKIVKGAKIDRKEIRIPGSQAAAINPASRV